MSIISIGLRDLEAIMIQRIRNADFEELGILAGKIFGGECWWFEGDTFHFEPLEDYTGDLVNFEEE